MATKYDYDTVFAELPEIWDQYSSQQLARMLGVDKNTIKKAGEHFKLPPKTKRSHDITHIQAVLDKHKYVSDAADELQMHHRYLSMLISKHNLKVTRYGKHAGQGGRYTTGDKIRPARSR